MLVGLVLGFGFKVGVVGKKVVSWLLKNVVIVGLVKECNDRSLIIVM